MERWHRVTWLFAFLLIAWPLGITAQINASPKNNETVDPKFFQDLRWRSIGPARAGRVVAVAGVRGEPEVYYFGSVGGGVWKTNDAGRTWNPIFDSQPVASIGAIALAPSNPEIIYVGSGEADMRSSISTGNGMYKSNDGGKTWVLIGLADSRQIGRILIDPKDPNKLYVAALGHAYGPNPERGVFRSNDGGKNWQRILFKDENTGAIDLAFEPGNPQTIYASLWQTRRPPWSIYPPSNGPDGGLYRSDDAAQNWKRLSNDRRIWQRGWYFGELIVDPKNPDIVYIPNTTAYKSTDGGVTFNAWKGAPGGDDYHELWIDPDQPQRMIMGCDQGAIVTRNSGETWSSWFNQPTGQFYHVNTDNRFPYWVYGAQQDSNAMATPSRSNYRSLNFHDWRPIEAGGENGYIAPDPLNRGVTYGGTVTRQDFSNEEIQMMPPTLAQTGSFRQTWTLPLVFSPIDAHILYFGSNFLFRSADGGSSWQEISPDLTREDPGIPVNLDPVTAKDAPANKRRGVIYTIAPSSVQKGEIWTGTDDGLIHLTQDEGKTWSNVTPPEISSWSKVTHIEASHFDAGTAYAAIDRHRLEDLNPYLYRTQDFGKSWTRVTRGIPDGSFLNCVREDPARKGLLYACTEKGVYVSFNDADNWQSLQFNLPVTSVRDLVVHENDLVVATFGRSFWILDDVTPLRQMDAHVAGADVWLFRPQSAIRMRAASDQGTPVPMEESLAANPPEGAMLDYFLKDKPATAIQMEIFDSEGKLVRRFASDDVLHKTNPSDVPLQVEWIRDPKPLLGEAGIHRFVWDLRLALPKGVRTTYWGPAGPLVVPGSYTVKLTANGKSSTQPLTIKLDPRVKTPQDALVRQFELASKLTSRLGEVSLALQQAGELRKQLDERKKEAGGNTELMTALQGLEKKLGAEVETDRDAEFGLFGIAAPGKEHEPLRHVAAALTGLLFIVDGSDLGPTTDAATSSERWNEAAQETLARWAAFQKDELENANALLRKTKLKTLSVE